MVYDYWCLLSNPEDLFTTGTKRFFPFTVLGWDKEGHSPYIQSTHAPEPCPPDNFIVGTLKGILLLVSSIISVFSPATAKGLREAVTAAGTVASMTKTVVVDGAIQGARAGSRVHGMTTSAVGGIERGLSRAGTLHPKVGAASPSHAPASPSPAVAHASVAPASPSPAVAHVPASPLQKGGNLLEKTPYDYAAFGAIAAFIASGLVFTLNRNSKDDSPPNTGRV